MANHSSHMGVLNYLMDPWVGLLTPNMLTALGYLLTVAAILQTTQDFVFLPPENEVAGRLCFYKCLWFCSWGRGFPACIAGLQAHTQGGSWGVWPGGSPGPHPGLSPGSHTEGVSRPTPGGVSRPTPGGGSPGPHPGGYPSIHWGRHPPPTDAYCCGCTHPTGKHSCLLLQGMLQETNCNYKGPDVLIEFETITQLQFYSDVWVRPVIKKTKEELPHGMSSFNNLLFCFGMTR